MAGPYSFILGVDCWDGARDYSTPVSVENIPGRGWGDLGGTAELDLSSQPMNLLSILYIPLPSPRIIDQSTS